jgi:hypothetical protein
MTIRYNIDKFFDYLVRRRAWEVLNSDCGFDWYDNKQNQYIIDDTFKFIHESTNIRIMAIIFKDKTESFVGFDGKRYLISNDDMFIKSRIINQQMTDFVNRLLDIGIIDSTIHKYGTIYRPFNKEYEIYIYDIKRGGYIPIRQINEFEGVLTAGYLVGDELYHKHITWDNMKIIKIEHRILDLKAI